MMMIIGRCSGSQLQYILRSSCCNSRRTCIAALQPQTQGAHATSYNSMLCLSRRFHSSTTKTIALEGYSLDHPECNIPTNIAARIGTNLHLKPNHPLCIIKSMIASYWNDRESGFESIDSLGPVVSTTANFDSLLIPPDHVSRSRSDTYYLRNDRVLRTHTSATSSAAAVAG
jgi:phenylalanyl-tRNA synthetase alpha subunit